MMECSRSVIESDLLKQKVEKNKKTLKRFEGDLMCSDVRTSVRTSRFHFPFFLWTCSSLFIKNVNPCSKRCNK